MRDWWKWRIDFIDTAEGNSEGGRFYLTSVSILLLNGPNMSNKRQKIGKATDSDVTTELSNDFSEEKQDWGVYFTHDVWQHLAPFLDYKDLKNCRMVSKNMKAAIFGSTNFIKHTTFKLNCENILLSHWDAMKQMWKTLRINAFGEFGDITWLLPLLAEVEDLRIFVGQNDEYVWSWVERTKPVVDLSLKLLLEATKKLRKLTLSHDFFVWASAKNNFPFSQNALRSLENVTEFILEGEDNHIYHHVSPETLNPWYTALAMGLVSLRRYTLNGYKESLRLSCRHQPWNSIRAQETFLIKIATVNKNHLTCLELPAYVFLVSESVCEGALLPKMVFPSLMTLKIEWRRQAHGQRNVAQFLRNQPLLLDVEFSPPEFLRSDLLETLADRSGNLRRLRIDVMYFIRRIRKPNFWRFLSNSQKLEDVNMRLHNRDDTIWPFRRMPKPTWFDADTILKNLPPSVEKIELRGIRNSNDNFQKITICSLLNLNSDVLTKLAISECGNCIDDEVLQFLWRQFKRLRELHLTTIQDCTDYGFTGISGIQHGPTFSIAELKGLRSLTLKSCGKISDQTLVHGIRFTRLAVLDLCHNPEITLEGCKIMLKHNPRLETFKASIKVSQEELKKFHPGLIRYTEQVSDESDEDENYSDVDEDYSDNDEDHYDDNEDDDEDYSDGNEDDDEDHSDDNEDDDEDEDDYDHMLCSVV